MDEQKIRYIIEDFFNYYSYDTGWIANSDWTNAEFTITHNLNAALYNLLIKFIISTDGTDANSFEIINTTRVDGSTTHMFGIHIDQIDNNSILIQTGEAGIYDLTTAGGGYIIDTESWYYKVKVLKIGFP